MVVIIDYNDLLSEDRNEELLNSVGTAVGSSDDAMGVIFIRNVPGFVEAKMKLLPCAYKLSQLPQQQLEQLEDPPSFFNAGWSYGKEKLKPNVPDTNKASFYFNPVTDVPGTREDRDKYPASYPCNRWPTKGLPQLEPAAKHLGCMLKDVAILLSKQIDAYVADEVEKQNEDGANGQKTGMKKPLSLFEILDGTEKVKGRLLYYYPLPPQQADETKEETAASNDSWIGWHNDSGFLTALAGDLYFDPATGKVVDTKPQNTGLQIVDRSDAPRLVTIPPDCMAVQIGECTQILTGGLVVATPHSVRGAPGIARASLACFIDTPPGFPLTMPDGVTRQQVIKSQQSKLVPPLELRWKQSGMTFGDFLQTTFEHYYDW